MEVSWLYELLDNSLQYLHSSSLSQPIQGQLEVANKNKGKSNTGMGEVNEEFRGTIITYLPTL